MSQIKELISKGELLIEEKKFSEAIEIYDEIISIEDNIVHSNKLAECYFELEDYERSLEIYEMNLAIEPENITTIVGKGSALRKLKTYDDSEKILEEALSKHPSNEDIIIGLAYLNYDMKRHEKALEYVNRLVDLGVNSKTIWEISALSSMALGRMEDVNNSIDRILLFERTPIHLSFKGRICEMLGDISGAESCYEEIFEKDDKNVEAVIGMSQLYFKKKEYGKIIEACNKVINNGVIDGAIMLHKGMALHGMGSLNEAILVLREADALEDIPEQIKNQIKGLIRMIEPTMARRMADPFL